MEFNLGFKGLRENGENKCKVSMTVKQILRIKIMLKLAGQNCSEQCPVQVLCVCVFVWPEGERLCLCRLNWTLSD